MADAIGPGSWVICIDNSSKAGTAWPPGERLTPGALYQVADCFVNYRGKPSVAIVRRERYRSSIQHGARVGYGVWRFRPAFDGDDAALRKTTQPIREDA